MDKEFLNGQYQFENERKGNFANAMAVPVGALTVIGGLLGLLSRDFSYQSTNLNFVFSILLGLGALLFLISISFLLCAYHGYSYSYLPTTKELRAYYEGLIAHYRSSLPTESEPNVAARAQSHFEKKLEQWYVEVITDNAANNDKRSGYIYKANSFLIAALAATIAAGVPFIIDSKTKRGDVQEVRVVNLPPLSQEVNRNAGNVGPHKPRTRERSARSETGPPSNSNTAATGTSDP